MTRSHGRLNASAASGGYDSPAASTKERIIAAAIQTLREEGFAGTSARSIARRGGFNQALIFYHFGSVLDLLVAVLEVMSTDRLAQYRAAIADVPDLRTALSTARQQYETDVREGHIAVLVELVAGASSAPLLGPEIVRCMEPWIGFAEESIARFLGGTPLATVIPPREAAHALLAIYLGMELLDHLDPDADTAGPLFHVAERRHPRNKLERRLARHVKGMRRIHADRAQHGNDRTCSCFRTEGRGRNFARFADHPQACSCPACGNPRRHWGGRTVQERRRESS